MATTEKNMDADVRDEPLFAKLDDGDPALAEAVIEAQKTLPQFMAAASKVQFLPATYLVKVPLLDRSDTGDEALVFTPNVASGKPSGTICHLWLEVTSVLADLVFCSVGEAPAELRLKKGASFVIEGEVIEDWMINHDGIAYGGFSLRVIRSRLREREQVTFDDHTGIREFRKLVP